MSQLKYVNAEMHCIPNTIEINLKEGGWLSGRVLELKMRGADSRFIG